LNFDESVVKVWFKNCHIMWRKQQWNTKQWLLPVPPNQTVSVKEEETPQPKTAANTCPASPGISG
ncbi:hypothetical protein DBR06_SOUSAS46010005, partial [Sousa chinensis]